MMVDDLVQNHAPYPGFEETEGRYIALPCL